MNQRSFLYKCLVVMAVVAFALCAHGAAQAAKVLRLVTPYQVRTLDPIKSIEAGDITMLGQLHSRLLRTTSDGKTLLPGLAEKWEASADGLIYTFYLRDAKFSDGTPVTAEDVAFSFTRLLESKESVYKGPFSPIEKAEAKDSKTVVFKLKFPAATFMGSMEIFNAGIVQKSGVMAQGDEEFFRKPVVSGPFYVEEWKPGDRLILKRNPHYWRQGLPYIEEVEWIEVADATTRVNMVSAGEAHVALDMPFNRIEELRKTKGIELPMEPSSKIFVILLNHDKEPFNDVRVRQAFAHAIDPNAIIKAVTHGHATLANSLLPNALDYYNPNLPGIPYNPEKARALLAEAGKSNLEFELNFTAGRPYWQQIGVLTQAQLAAIGVKMNLQTTDLGMYWKKLKAGDYQATPSWWYNETTDPDLAVRWALCGNCGNRCFYTNYNNERVNQLTEEGLRELDKEKRQAIYYEIQKITLDDVAQIPLYYSPYTHAYRGVTGLKMNPAIQFNLDEAKLVR